MNGIGNQPSLHVALISYDFIHNACKHVIACSKDIDKGWAMLDFALQLNAISFERHKIATLY